MDCCVRDNDVLFIEQYLFADFGDYVVVLMVSLALRGLVLKVAILYIKGVVLSQIGAVSGKNVCLEEGSIFSEKSV